MVCRDWPTEHSDASVLWYGILDTVRYRVAHPPDEVRTGAS